MSCDTSAARPWPAAWQNGIDPRPSTCRPTRDPWHARSRWNAATGMKPGPVRWKLTWWSITVVLPPVITPTPSLSSTSSQDTVAALPCSVADKAGIAKALERILTEWPYAVWGIHSDNGSEFISAHLIRFTQAHGLSLTRSRPYKKKDRTEESVFGAGHRRLRSVRHTRTGGMAQYRVRPARRLRQRLPAAAQGGQQEARGQPRTQEVRRRPNAPAAGV
ncbi:protein of unknown function [Kyrpidia spormannii]|uniref:Uncharacterized protein n=1 Tax=Kyrpidia spormannii TaxID=2055160 RepID=A0ACA8Z8M1_9BACL|nr:protein of unknown function [Kyrpidia spormannii]